jgi:tetratricopeptide (TPR) repeat protein
LLVKKFKKDPVAYEFAAILVGESSEEYLNLLNKGLKANKHSEPLLVMKTNYYIGIEENELALKTANKLMDIAPEKVDYLVVRGAIYQHLEMEEEAIQDFHSIIEKSPKNFTANYGIGSIYFNRAADIHEKANETEDNDLYKKHTEEATALMKTALPFLQRAYLSKREDKEVINALKTCYLRLGMTERYKKMMEYH